MSDAPISLAELIAALERIARVAPGGQSRNPRAGLDATLTFLNQAPTATVDEWVDQLSAQARTGVAVDKPQSSVRIEVVEHHISALNTAGFESAAFETALSSLRGDPKVRLIELRAVAEAYIGAKPRFQSKPLGLKIIEQTFDQRWKLATRRSQS